MHTITVRHNRSCVCCERADEYHLHAVTPFYRVAVASSTINGPPASVISTTRSICLSP